MIQNLEYFIYKYITGPTCDCNKHWMMSDVNTIKFGESHKNYSHMLTFDRASDMCQLKTTNGIIVDNIQFNVLLSYLRDKKFLVGWKPINELKYTEADYRNVGYIGG